MPICEFPDASLRLASPAGALRNGKAVRLGKAKARGKHVVRLVVDKVDAELVVKLRKEGKSWLEIAEDQLQRRS